MYQIHVLLFFSLLSVFGYLAYRNMERLHTRVRPGAGQLTSSRDREVLTMVLAEVITYIIATFSYPFVLLEISITTYLNITKSTRYIQIEGLLSMITALLVNISAGNAFYLFIIVSKRFRKDFFKLFC